MQSTRRRRSPIDVADPRIHPTLTQGTRNEAQPTDHRGDGPHRPSPGRDRDDVVCRGTHRRAAGSPQAVATSAAAVGYDISIHTANVPYAGTDGDVWLRVNGTNGSTQYWKLDDAADNYERNRTDRFLRSGVNVGTIRSVTIYFNPLGGANAEWLPDRVTVNGITFRNSSWFLKGAPTYRTLTA